jgi:hypothetical protein
VARRLLRPALVRQPYATNAVVDRQTTDVASEWPIIDAAGFEDLRLGDEREVVRRRFGAFRAFRRGRSTRETDQFLSSGVMVTYNAEGLVSFVEVAPPSNPTIRGVQLLGRPASAVTRDLALVGVGAVQDEAGVQLDCGVGLFVPLDDVAGVSFGSG